MCSCSKRINQCLSLEKKLLQNVHKKEKKIIKAEKQPQLQQRTDLFHIKTNKIACTQSELVILKKENTNSFLHEKKNIQRSMRKKNKKKVVIFFFVLFVRDLDHFVT